MMEHKSVIGAWRNAESKRCFHMIIFLNCRQTNLASLLGFAHFIKFIVSQTLEAKKKYTF
jgi:hypothetical protein